MNRARLKNGVKDLHFLAENRGSSWLQKRPLYATCLHIPLTQTSCKLSRGFARPILVAKFTDKVDCRLTVIFWKWIFIEFVENANNRKTLIKSKMRKEKHKPHIISPNESMKRPQIFVIKTRSQPPPTRSNIESHVKINMFIR